MVSPKILLAILITVIAGGLALLVFQQWIPGGILTGLGLGLLYLWWRMNQIVQISDALVKDDLAGARRRINSVKNPHKLNRLSKTYYYFFRGMVGVRENNLKDARQDFKTSLDTNYFRSVDEKATVYLMLAQLDLRGRNMEGARRNLREARGLNPGDQIRAQINDVVKQARLKL